MSFIPCVTLNMLWIKKAILFFFPLCLFGILMSNSPLENSSREHNTGFAQMKNGENTLSIDTYVLRRARERKFGPN